MNSNWRNRPTSITSFSRKDIDYIVGIDESGSSSLKQVLKAKSKGETVNIGERHFTIAAVGFASKDFKIIEEMIKNIKYKYWDNGYFLYNGIQKRVCFHSREIRYKQSAFSPNVINYDAFIQDLSALMQDAPYTLYTSHIDKVCHIDKYFHPEQPYNLCMTFVLERILISAQPYNSLVIILESRGTAEDKKLLDFIIEIIDNGTNFISAKEFKKIKGVYFNTKWCKAMGDQSSFWELELADLCVYPINNHFAHGSEHEDGRDYQILLQKIYGYPKITGKGLKSFP